MFLSERHASTAIILVMRTPANGGMKWCAASLIGAICSTRISRSEEGRSMNTYQPMSLATGLLSDDPLDPEHLGYLHARAQNKAHDCVLAVFADEAGARGINRAYIARRLRKRPEVVSRCLTAPGNWTLDTLGELLGSMGYDVDINARSFRNPILPNRVHDMAISDISGQPTTIIRPGGPTDPVSGLTISGGTEYGNIRLTSTS